MPLDTFICGSCQGSFNDIEQFILHKNSLCGQQTDESSSQLAASADDSEYVQTENHEDSPGVDTGQQIAEILDMDSMVSSVNGVSRVVSFSGAEEALLTGTGQVFQGENMQTVIILQGDMPHLSLENAGQFLAEVSQEQPNNEYLASLYKKKGRGGRPRKTKKEETIKVEEPKEKVADIGTDGKLTCQRCKKVFNRERVFNAHKCIAMSEYVDFTTKDIANIDPDDNDLPQDDLVDAGALEDDDAEYRVPANVKLETESDSAGPGLGTEVEYTTRVINGKIVSSRHSEGTSEDNQDVDLEQVARYAEQGSNEGSTEGQQVQQSSEAKEIPVQLSSGPDIEDTVRDMVGTTPMFLSEEDKAKFEASLNVDLSGIDHMFQTHGIKQEVNMDIAQPSRFCNTMLTLFSCNTCDKVFKSLSHMRFHVLTHTTLRPYKCFKCNYDSNCRGNLYTHMRKHTGQYYHCDHCKFQTVNKSHLAEHQLIHTSDKQRCKICNKLYNTQKSLMSHIRKYHDNAKGKEYLATFMQGRDMRGTTVIHQCHVCNRKFKKKTDRDRHLFVHDIKDMSIIQHCQLCSYSASRPKYLEKHFQKHRCLYRCCKCEQIFLSSSRLVEHLTSLHSDTDDPATWEALFEASIATSLYLPEPDTNLPSNEKSFVNLPEELSEVAITRQERLQNTGEDYLPMCNADAFINIDPLESGITSESAEAVEGLEQSAMEDGVVSMDTSNHGNQVTFSNHDNQESENDHDLSATKEGSDENCPDTDDVAQNNSCDMNIESNASNVEQQRDVTDKENKEPMELEDNMESDSRDVEQASEDVDEDTAVVEETDLTEEDLLGPVKPRTGSVARLIEKLGYKPMSLQIFQKMRDTFGSEECEYCGRLFFSRTDYEPHVLTHTGDKPFLCTKCNFRSISKDNLRRHMDKEHDNVSYPCRECAFVAYTRTQLWNHALKHKGLKGLECPSCREQFENMSELKEHADTIHPNANIEGLDKLISNKHKLQGKIGRRSYKCPHCDKVFVRASSELQKHMWIHEGIKPFKCPLCPYACRSKNNLQAHMLRHSKDKPFHCGDCGKAYKSKTALRWHVRAHAGKLFKCDQCPYEATQASHLKRHMETHSVKRRYACKDCQYSANTLGFLKVHYARFHKSVESTDIPVIAQDVTGMQADNCFKCLSCDYLFGNLSDLKRHLKSRHQIDVNDLSQVVNESSNELQVQIGEQGIQQVEGYPIMEIKLDQAQIADGNLDEKTASVVSILNQIMGLQQGGAGLGAGLRQGEGHEHQQGVVVTQENIVVENDGSHVYHVNAGTTGLDDSQVYHVSGNTATTEIDGHQYVIQYVSQAEDGCVEVQGDSIEEEVMTEDHVTTHDQILAEGHVTTQGQIIMDGQVLTEGQVMS
ncbi:zinc finger protein ZFAT-like isoform X2 [Dreissena polymorpha]|uniref:C2H2-type domain-containing protein n=1 Tax=Dreissena polymorpha TaxID=45954 RepID=A0A9D4DYT9_DREPO|nr:zinc finger protein ZFAT-like isoform X2 [Dreissena polymorpha]KAH3768960.1 hypothetical protein DPMN_170181 [Dreissena polymorpha]